MRGSDEGMKAIGHVNVEKVSREKNQKHSRFLLNIYNSSFKYPSTWKRIQYPSSSSSQTSVIVFEFSAIKVARLNPRTLACGASKRTHPVTINAVRHFFLIPTKLHYDCASSRTKPAFLCASSTAREAWLSVVSLCSTVNLGFIENRNANPNCNTHQPN